MPDLLEWLRATTSTWTPEALGLLVRTPAAEGPYRADSLDELVAELDRREALIALPTEPAALANVVEGAMLTHLHDALDGLDADGHDVARQTAGERHYPDLEVSGGYFAPDGDRDAFHAVDIKVARRKPRKRGAPTKTQSRITLYTGNTYFKYPDLHVTGCLRPFGEYASHLDVIVLYDFRPELTGRVANVEVLVQPAWKIASDKRSSTTREYIGAVDDLEDLRGGRGTFESPEAFYDFWRRYKFKPSQEIINLLERERRA